jgi:hypothetical protein
MKTTKTAAIVLAYLTACAILLGIDATAEQPQTKDLKFHGQNVVMVDLWSPVFNWVILEEMGEMTHVGRYVCEGGGRIGPGGIQGSGTLTTASGDVLLWAANGPTVTLTGLTGRFTGAVGSFEVTRTVTNIEFSPDGRYQIITYRQQGVGTITY